jgi:hypothetical protein
MTKRIPGRTIYAATILAMLGLVGGYALATISITASTQTGEANYISAGGAITGLSYTSTVLSMTSNPAPAASTGTSSAPQLLLIGANAFCANTCTAGDVAEIVTYTFTTSFAGAAQIKMQVTASSGGGSTTFYLAQAVVAVSGTIVLTWDMGTSTSTITAVTLTAQQCSSSTSCP